MTETTPDRDSQSALGLTRRLLGEIATLFRQELALARTESLRNLKQLLAGSISVVVGGAVLYAGMLVLLAAAVLGLANWVAPWLAALIIGLIVGIIGYLLVHVGARKIGGTAVAPAMSADSLQRDKDVLTRRAS